MKEKRIGGGERVEKRNNGAQQIWTENPVTKAYISGAVQ